MTRVLLTLLLLGCAVSGGLALRGRQQNKVTPVEQVITLMEDLIAQTKEEGSAEATTYDEFSCFCKDTTKEKSDAIGKDRNVSLWQVTDVTRPISVCRGAFSTWSYELPDGGVVSFSVAP